MALRIFVADDHEVVRRGICALLTSHSGWEICGEAGDGREAVEKVVRLKPDIVILDIGMPALNGLDAARQIMHNDPHQKIAILSVMESEQVIHEALKAGARAYISKSDGAKELISRISTTRTFCWVSASANRLSRLAGTLQPAPRPQRALLVCQPGMRIFARTSNASTCPRWSFTAMQTVLCRLPQRDSGPQS